MTHTMGLHKGKQREEWHIRLGFIRVNIRI